MKKVKISTVWPLDMIYLKTASWFSVRIVIIAAQSQKLNFPHKLKQVWFTAHGN